MTSRTADESSLSRKERKEEDASISSIPRTPLRASKRGRDVITTPSSVLIDKFRDLDGHWSATKAQNSFHVDTESQSRASSRTSLRTPTKPLIDKYQSLEQTWSAAKSVSSQRSSLSGTPFSFARDHRPVLSLVVPSSGGNQLPDPRQQQRTKKTRNSRLFFSPVADPSPDGNASVGESTISTISSSESVFDRLYRLGLRTPRNNQVVTTFSERRAATYTPKIKMASYTSPYNSKNRVGNYHTPSSLQKIGKKSTTRAVPNRSTQRGKGGLSSDRNFNDENSAVSTLSDYDDDSVFARLHRNERRTEKLWKKPHPKILVKPSQQSSSKVSPTISIDEDLAVIQAVGEELNSMQQLHKTPTTTPKASGSQPIDHGSSASSAFNILFLEAELSPTISIDEDLAEIQAFGEELNSMQQRYKTPTTTPKASGSQPIDHGSSASSAFNILFPESPTTATMISEILSEKTFYDSQQKTIDYFEKTGGMNSKPSDEPSYPDIQKDSITTLDEDIAALQAVGKEIESMQLKQITPRTSQLFRTDTPTTSRSMSSEPFSEQTFSESTELELSAEKPIMVGTSKENNRTPPNFKMRTPVKSNVVRSGFFSLDEPSGGLVMDYHGPCDPCGPSPLAQCIELLVSPLLRRRRPQDGEQLVTPRGLKNAAIVTLQSRWRSHRAEISLVSKLIDSWNIELRFGNSQFDRMIVPHSRVIAIANAIKNVDCWWILDGLQIQGDFINMSWQREVDVGFCNHYDGLQILDTVRVSLFVRARRNIATNSWSRRKLALLFAKAGLEKALQEEVNRRDICAVERIQRWVRGIQKDRKQSDAAITIQNWIRNVQRVSTEIQRPPTTIVLSSPKAPLLRNNYATTYSTAESLLQLTTLEARMHKEFPNTTTGSPKRKSKTNDGNKAQQHHAAVSIQNCFRMWALNSALSESSEPKVELQRALVNVGSPAEKQLFSELAEARDVPRIFSENEQWYQLTPTIQSDSFQRWHPTGNPIERRAASLAIHNIVRAYLMGLRKYRRKKKVILIQSTWRRYRACQKFAMQRFAVLVIQFAWNNYKYAQQCKENAIKIQRRWRFILRQRMFLILQFSATVLQASWRKTMAKRRFVAILRVAVWCQRAIRGYPVRQEFLAFRSAVLSLQRVYRQKCVRDVYQLQSSRAVVIQAYWRRASAKKKLVLSIHAIVRLQRMLRGLSTCRRFHYRRQQVIGIQQAWRRYSKWKLERLMESSALVIQTKWRSALARQKWESTLFSARCLQSVARGHLCRTRVSLEKKSATLVEAKWRSFSQKKLFLLRMRNIIALQTWYRGVHTRASFKKTFVASIQCQRVFRGFSQRKEYIRMRKASVQIQKNFLCWMTMKNFARGKNAAVVIQKYWRKNIAQNYLARSILLAINLQRLCREFAERKKVHNRMAVIIRIQKAWRLYDTNKRVSLARKQLQATCLIQKSVRGFIQRRHLQRLRAEATVVQAIWRGAVFRSAYTTVRAYTIMIQSCMRGFLHRKRLCRNQDAAIQVERIWRGALARSHFQSLRNEETNACAIQRSWRTFHAKNEFFEPRCAAVVIQSQIRRYQAVESLSLQKRSERMGAIVLQNAWRTYVAREQANQLKKQCILSKERNAAAFRLQQEHSRRSQACMIIQACWRGSEARENYSKARISVETIQLLARTWLASRALSRRVLVCRRIQALARGRQAYVSYRRRVSLIVHIQKHWRSSIARDAFAQNRAAAITIGASVRGYLVRRRLEQQQYRRAWLARSTFRMLRYSAVTVQALARGNIVRRALQQERTSKTVLIDATLIIQKHWRASLPRSRYLIVRASLIMIQTLVRGSFTRRRLQKKIATAIILQRIWRGESCRLSISRLRNRKLLMLQTQEFASVTIQSIWRMHHHRSAFWSSRGAATRIQVFARHVFTLVQIRLARQLAKRTFVVEHFAASRIQKFWRHVLVNKQFTSACDIQTITRGHHCHRGFENARSGVIRIQSVWRRAICRVKIQLKNDAAVRIQAFWWGAYTREKYKIKTVFILQALTHRHAASLQLKSTITSSTYIQSAWRRWKSVKDFKASKSVIIFIQKHWRASVARNHFLITRSCAVMIQSAFRRTLVLMVFWFMRLPKEERIHVDNAARTIQIAFFHWKMQLAVCEMQSWLIILQRSIIRGQLVRSAARFALAHMNLSLRSSALEYMARLIANANPDIVSTIIAWNRSVAGAHESAAIVIQSAGRRMIARNIVRSHFDVTFDVSILVDDQMVEKERKAASLIQKTFRGQFLKVRDAAIFIQSSWRGTRAARCSRQPSIRSEKVDAIAKVLERAEIVSENRTAQLLSGSGSGDLFGPCLLRLANRVRSATADETAFSASPLPYFAVAILGNNEATRNGKTEGTIFTTCSPVRTKPQISIQTEEHSPVSPSENESLSLRKTSTPVTCNKTPSREGFGNAVDIFSPVRILNLRPEHTDRTVDRTVVKEMSAVAKSKHDSGQSTTLRGVEGLASQAQWLPSEGRKEMRINAIQPVVPILKSIDTTKTAPVRKKSQKTANTPINVQLGPKNPKIDSNLAKESNVGRGQGGAISGSLFGDSEELLSPIKKKVSDWDWADKW